VTKVNRFLLWIAAALLVIVVAANEAVWLHAFGFMGSRLGLWGSFRLDNAELRMRSGWYAIQKASDYKGPGIPSSALLAFKSEWPKFGARNQIGINLPHPVPTSRKWKSFRGVTRYFCALVIPYLFQKLKFLWQAAPAMKGALVRQYRT